MNKRYFTFISTVLVFIIIFLVSCAIRRGATTTEPTKVETASLLGVEYKSMNGERIVIRYSGKPEINTRRDGNSFVVELSGCIDSTSQKELPPQGSLEKVYWVQFETRVSIFIESKNPIGYKPIYTLGKLSVEIESSEIKEKMSNLTNNGNIDEFKGSISPLPSEIKAKMRKYSWREGCPVSLDELAYLELSYWGFDDKIHLGQMVVHRKAASEVYGIFRELFKLKFPVEKMELVDIFLGSDEKSMAANNTSGFNCRYVAGSKTVWSKHAYGMAIDVNPLVNPYVKGGKVYPPKGKAYLDRKSKAKGIIVKGGPCYQAFTSKGWTWGGNWRNSKDYQHFQKVYP